MPPGQDDNPFGTPRGAWGRQPPTTFGLSTPVRRPSRASNQIRVPAPSAPPRNILTGGLVPQARREPPPAPPPPAPQIAPEPVVEIAAGPLAAQPDPILASEPVLAGAASARRGRGLPFPPVAGIGLVIAAIVVAGVLLLRHAPSGPETVSASAPTPLPAVESSPAASPVVAEAAPVAESVAPAAPVVKPAPSKARRAVEPAAQAAAPIAPPPLEAPPIVSAPAPPPPAAAVPPNTDPDAPMTTRLPQ